MTTRVKYVVKQDGDQDGIIIKTNKISFSLYGTSKERVMDMLSGFLILGALFGIFVAIQKLNSNIITQIDQNEKIIELLKELNNK
jgi:hypothetical protein